MHRHALLIPTHSLIIALLAAVAACCMTQPAAAQFGASEPKVRMHVMPDKQRVNVGETFHLAVVFDTDPGWHIYWKNPGAGAAAPWVEVEGPDSCTLAEIRWPRPKVIKSEVGDMYCYEGRTILYVPVTVQAAPAEGGAALFMINLGCAVCDDDACFMHDVRVTTQVQINESGIGSRRPPTKVPPLPSDLPGDDSEYREQLRKDIAEHVKHLPVQIGDDAEVNKKHDVKVTYEQGMLTVTGKAHGLEEATFFPGGINGISFTDITCEVDNSDDQFTFSATVEINRRNILVDKPRITGLIALGKKRTGKSYEFTLPFRADTK